MSSHGSSKASSTSDGSSHHPVILQPSSFGGLSFESEAEQRYFHTFQSETAYEICGIFESVFWQRLVLQTCHQEKFVLDAVIALSAYNTSLKLSKFAGTDEVCLATAAEQAQFALRKYQNSLQVMRTSLGAKACPRKALIACLLVCSFEGLFGNTVTALAHARSGQTLVENFLAEHPHAVPEQEGITSPAPQIIEDKLLQAAFYFETQIIGLYDGRSPQDHAKMKTEGKKTIVGMPKTFKDLDQALAYWDLVSRRSMHFICEYSTDSYQSLNPYPDHERTEPISDNPRLAFGKDDDCSKREAMLHRYQTDRKIHLDDIAQWSAAFSDLYSRLKRTTNKRQIMGAHTLYVKSRNLEMGVGSAMESGMCSHDKYFSHFREIVTLSKEIIRVKKTFSQSDFAVELGIIPSLHTTAKCCRERTIRREAIALLQWYDSREGHWDSRSMAEIDGCVMELEEEGIDTEFIPECARIRVLSITSDEVGDLATIEYVRGTPRTGELPGRKRIKCPGRIQSSQTVPRRGSEESTSSVDSIFGFTSYEKDLLVPFDHIDEGHDSDELGRSSSCSTPRGYLFEQQSVNR